MDMVAVDNDEEEDVDSEERPDLVFEIGDMSHPTRPANGPVVLLHVVDDSGVYGRGGVFTVLANLSPFIADAYERAGKMEDLAPGDAHLVTLDLVRSDDSAVHVCLVCYACQD